VVASETKELAIQVEPNARWHSRTYTATVQQDEAKHTPAAGQGDRRQRVSVSCGACTTGRVDNDSPRSTTDVRSHANDRIIGRAPRSKLPSEEVARATSHGLRPSRMDQRKNRDPKNNELSRTGYSTERTRTIKKIREMASPSTTANAKRAASKTATTSVFRECLPIAAIYHDGWYLRRADGAPVMGTAKLPEIKDYKWELYKHQRRYSQNYRPSPPREPDKLQELQAIVLDRGRRKIQVCVTLGNTGGTTPRPMRSRGANGLLLVRYRPSRTVTRRLINKDYPITAEITRFPRAARRE